MNDDNYTNNTNETPTNKGGVLSSVGKGLLAKVPLKYKLIAGGILAGAIASIFFIALIISLFTLESVNSTEVAGSNRYDKNTTNAYEQEVIDYQEDNNITQYVSSDNKEKSGHEAYYDALFKAYEQYKVNVNEKRNVFEFIADFFTGIFSPRSEIKAPAKNNVKDEETDDELNKPYGVQIDTSLLTTTLYSNRFYGDMILDEETQEKKKTEKYVDFYLDSTGHKYYDLHSKDFRDRVEKEYFDQARKDVENDNGNGDEALQKTKLAIEGIEILSKYMIQRVETYLTLNKDFVNVDYDTTRHIKIVHKFGMSEECFSYIDVIKTPVLDHKRSTGGEYRWKINTPLTCKNTYGDNDNLGRYDDATYDTKDVDNYSDQYSEGWDELSYERDCEGYKEYLLGNYPTVDDKIMFCGGEDKCYGDHFIPAYYHNYVPTTGEDRPERVEDIVYDIYSVLEFYENATMNYNVCSSNYTGGDSSIGDLSCGAVNPDFDLGDLDYIGDAYDIIVEPEYNNDPPLKIEICGEQKELLGRLADFALNLYNTAANEWGYYSGSDSERKNTYLGYKTGSKYRTDCNGFVGYVINRALHYDPDGDPNNEVTTSMRTFTFFGHGSGRNDRWSAHDSSLFTKKATGKTLDEVMEILKQNDDELRGAILASYGSGGHHIQIYVGNGQVVDMANKNKLTLRTNKGVSESTTAIRHGDGLFEIFVPNSRVC